MKDRPEKCTDEHLEYLDALRESGITNMYGSPEYLRKAYKGITKDESYKIVAYWMATFTERHNIAD